MSLTVKFASYGALPGNDAASSKAALANNVANILQYQINNKGGVVPINNDTMGGDPAHKHTKHFGAAVDRNGIVYYFACQEGQTIDFNSGGGTTSPSVPAAR